MIRFSLEEAIAKLFQAAIDHYIIPREYVVNLSGWARQYDVENFRTNCSKCHGNGIYFNPDWASCAGESFWSGDMGRWFACPDCELGHALKRLEDQALKAAKKESGYKTRMTNTMVECEAAFENRNRRKNQSQNKLIAPKKPSFWTRATALITRRM